MSANLRIDAPLEGLSDVTEALYFDSGEQRLFGWLHRPGAGKQSDMGLVICKPFGYEAICSHRSVRTFAESAAANGAHVLRFDYAGTGDSGDMDHGADQIHAWTRDVLSAVSELRRQTGVKRICLLGFRIGALLAVLAAERCETVMGLILIAPILNGRRYVKELRTTRMAAQLNSGASAARNGASADWDGLDSFEVSGFSFSAATLAALMTIDLKETHPSLPWGTLVIDSAGLPAAREWVDAGIRSGASVTYVASAGMVEMLMTAPQFAVVPTNMIAAMQEWLAQRVDAGRNSFNLENAGRTEFVGRSPQNVLVVKGGAGAESPRLTERAVRFGPDSILVGIVTEPPREERRRRAVILLNAGVDLHIGASRLYVSLARLWASLGYVVLRMDLSGIGDSGTRQGMRDDEVFPASALDDVRAAIDQLKNHYRIGDITLAGLCSGAYHALRAAAAGIMVTRVLMINPQNYFWKESMSITDLQVAEVVRNPGVYRQQIWSAAAWRRLLSGDVNLLRIFKVYVQRTYLAMVSLAKDLARRLHIRLPNDLGRELQEIAGRGIGIVFVFARGEPGYDLLRLEAGRSLSRLGTRCQIHILPSGDHVFSHRNSRAELERVLSDELLAPGVRALPI